MLENPLGQYFRHAILAVATRGQCQLTLASPLVPLIHQGEKGGRSKVFSVIIVASPGPNIAKRARGDYDPAHSLL